MSGCTSCSGGVSQAASSLKISDQLQISALKKTNDTQKEQGPVALQLLDAVPAPSGSKGNNIDTIV